MRRRRRPFLDDPTRPPPIPWEYAGQWVALDPSLRKVLASGATFAEASERAKALGHKDFVLDRGPRRDGASFVGAV